MQSLVSISTLRKDTPPARRSPPPSYGHSHNSPGPHDQVDIKTILETATKKRSTILQDANNAEISALVRRVLDSGDHVLMSSLVSIYHNFCSSADFFTHITADFDTYSEEKAYNTFRLVLVWLDHYFRKDFLRASTGKGNRLFNRLIEFVSKCTGNRVSVNGFAGSWTMKIRLLQLVNVPPHPTSTGIQQQLAVNRERNVRVSQDQRKKDKVLFADGFWLMSAQDLATCFTILESDMFRNISERELLNVNWKKCTSDYPSFNVLEMVARSNNVISYISTRVVKLKDVTTRALMVQFLISLADACVQQNNFNTAMSILGGLHSHPVQRLKRTWRKVNAREMKTLESLEALMSMKSNYKAYRSAIKKIRNSGDFCLPYLGIYLRDLVFIEEMPTRKNSSINLEKVEMVSNLLAEVNEFQDRHHNRIYPGDMLTKISHLGAITGEPDDVLLEYSKKREAPAHHDPSSQIDRDHSETSLTTESMVRSTSNTSFSETSSAAEQTSEWTTDGVEEESSGRSGDYLKRKSGLNQLQPARSLESLDSHRRDVRNPLRPTMS